MKVVATYEELMELVVNEGEIIYNKGNDCYTHAVANVVMVMSPDYFPICTTRKSFWKKAVLEVVSYLRGYSYLSQLHALNLHTWDANALNPKWLANPACKGEGHLGRIYGVQLLDWQTPNGDSVNQLAKIINNLKQGIDDRGEIMTMWNPGEHTLGCLRPCLYSYTFSLIGDTLHMAAVQRSADVPLGSNANVCYSWFVLWFMAYITGHKMGEVTLLMNNAHIYANQIELAREQIKRKPFPKPTFHLDHMHPYTLEELVLSTDEDPTEYMHLVGYEHHDAISYPFTTTNGVANG